MSKSLKIGFIAATCIFAILQSCGVPVSVDTRTSPVASDDVKKPGANNPNVATCTVESEKRKRFEKAEAAFGTVCNSEAQVRTCSKGIFAEWSGRFQFESCEVGPPQNCGNFVHDQKQNRTRFRDVSVPYNQNCQSEEQIRTCNNGNFTEWSGSFGQTSCEISPPATCGGIAHDTTQTRLAYFKASPAFGQQCQSETQNRKCTNGIFTTWSGSFTSTTCTPQGPASCGVTPSGADESRLRYQSPTVAFGSSCVVETQTRRCNNGNFGNWSGDYSSLNCTFSPAASCSGTPHEGSQIRTRYEFSSVNFGVICPSETQTRTCINGTFGNWSGRFAKDTCAPEPPQPCGNTAHGASESRTRFNSETAPANQCVMETQTRTCNNGNFGNWTGTYTFDKCDSPLSALSEPVSTTLEPSARHAAIYGWLDNRIIVWGGAGDYPTMYNNGSIYNPDANTWLTVPTNSNTPVGRQDPTQYIVGSQIIVWGGYLKNAASENLLTTGFKLGMNAAQNGFTFANIANFPVSIANPKRTRYTSVMGGNKIFIFSGVRYEKVSLSFNDGFTYDIPTDSWSAIPAFGVKRYDSTSIWTGSEMIVWGGYHSNGSPTYGLKTNTGGAYNPTTNSWRATSLVNAPEARVGHTATWIRGKMLIWGGKYDSKGYNPHNGIYDPQTDTWKSVKAEPRADRYFHKAFTISQNEVLVWGGAKNSTSNYPVSVCPTEACIYNIDSDSWRCTILSDLPNGRSDSVLVLKNRKLFTWGGADSCFVDSFQKVQSGGRFYTFD